LPLVTGRDLVTMRRHVQHLCWPALSHEL